MLNKLIEAMENGMIPDKGIRLGIQQLLKKRLRELESDSLSERRDRMHRYVQDLRSGDLAVFTREANEQHYELPPEFFIKCLGKNLKYSCAYWPKGVKTLDAAEDAALNVTMERAQIQDGMRILELGCGWGSLTLAMAKKFPNSKIIAISNSQPQREFIQERARERGLNNVTVLTRDISKMENFDLEGGKFDRVMSIEMFEHFKNYERLLAMVAGALKPEGKLFVHIFTHKEFAYPFETEGDDNWMGKYFFTGGQMPSHHLFYYFQNDLKVQRSWTWDGIHYEKTCNAWLAKMDAERDTIMELFTKTYGPDAKIWFNRWRVFYMACAELFGHKGGQEWAVSHYLFSRS